MTLDRYNCTVREKIEDSLYNRQELPTSFVVLGNAVNHICVRITLITGGDDNNQQNVQDSVTGERHSLIVNGIHVRFKKDAKKMTSCFGERSRISF